MKKHLLYETAFISGRGRYWREQSNGSFPPSIRSCLHTWIHSGGSLLWHHIFNPYLGTSSII